MVAPNPGPLLFTKAEGLGNDFLIVDAEALHESLFAVVARLVCNRHFGVGADGLIVYRHSLLLSADFHMRLFNADGSEAEISGNGLRCLAACLYLHQLHPRPEMRIETRAGIKTIRQMTADPPFYVLQVEMGSPILEAARIPLNLLPEPPSLVGCELAVGNEAYSVTITSMGNPHCSIFVDDFDALGWEKIGNRVESHPAFPQRTNVEFIRVLARNKVEVRFWERGVGRTKASGTGSCAAVVASVLNGYTERDVDVITEGGILNIQWGSDGTILMKGPARVICEGEYYQK